MSFQQQNENNKEKIKQFNYELLDQASHKQQKYCCALAIDHFKNLLITAAESYINVFQFKNGSLKLVRSDKNHRSDVTTLNFFINKSQFISASDDATLIIWSHHLFSNLKYLHKLKGHLDCIYCVVIYPLSEDLIITGSGDSTIKFWSLNSFNKNKLGLSWQYQQTIETDNHSVYGLSINKNGSKLLACGENNQILVMEGSSKTLWQVKQKIKTLEYGIRLSFINDNNFTFQSWQGENLSIYQFDNTIQKFSLFKDVSVEDNQNYCFLFFPQFYCQEKQILINKNGHSINVIKCRFDSSGLEFKLEQVIKFKSQLNSSGFVFGTISEDGEFLITWDFDSKEIQIRQYKEKGLVQ